MLIQAEVRNQRNDHVAKVTSSGRTVALAIPTGASGSGSGVNGGELLCLSLATCYCNDLYREAADCGIAITSVDVEVTATFGGRGEAAREISYRVTLAGDADRDTLIALAKHTDTVAEIHNTLRLGMPVTLAGVEITES